MTLSLGDVVRAPDVQALVDAAAHYPDGAGGMKRGEAIMIILAVLRVYGCRPDSHAIVYAWDALATAFGRERAQGVLGALDGIERRDRFEAMSPEERAAYIADLKANRPA